MPELIGQERVIDVLQRLIASGRLGHAVLFVGTPGVNKRALADWLVGQIGSTDVMVIERELNDKDELKKNISIEQVRKLVERLHLTAFGDGYKVGIIEDAELLSTEAANALLKTIEEPSGKTLVILLATSTAMIPATVLSRCQVLYLPPPLSVALTDEDRESVDLLNRLLSASLPEQLGQLQAIGKQSREEAERLVDAWEVELYRLHRYDLLKRLADVRRGLRQNVNQTLALEHLFIYA